MDTSDQPEKSTNNPTSVRISPTCRYLWERLAGKYGLSPNKYMEVLMREKAKEEGIPFPDDPPPPPEKD